MKETGGSDSVVFLRLEDVERRGGLVVGVVDTSEPSLLCCSSPGPGDRILLWRDNVIMITIMLLWQR